MPRAARLLPLAVAVLAAAFTGNARAAIQMPIGFYDDISFRWSPDRQQNIQEAAADGASIIHTTAYWPELATKRPAHALDGDDPAYRLADLDELVSTATQNGIRVMIDIDGTPKWANGGKSPNHMPKKLRDLTNFAHMLAERYDGTNGHGSVSLYSVWNEPNLSLFLTPQYVVKHKRVKGKKVTTFTIVGPRNYGKLYKAAYAGIKAGNRLAKVAIGETSARGRDKPGKTKSDSVAPATFARLLAQTKGLKFDAWAHHPYPTTPSMRPLQRVRYPNVTLSTMPQFEKDLRRWYHHKVSVWITEYGHETKPGERHGVSNATQAKWAKQALGIARKDPNVGMFIWFTFRDSKGNPWQSGLLKPSGAKKPAYNAFGSLARTIDGDTFTVRHGRRPVVRLYFPTLFFFQGTGGTIGLTYHVLDDGRVVGVDQPVVPFAADGSVTIPLDFVPVRNHIYEVVVEANEANGHFETETATLEAT